MNKKIKQVRFLLLLFVLLFAIQSCGQNSNTVQITFSKNNEEDSGTKFLKSFYEEYISACCELPQDENILENIKKKYLSNNLYNQLNIAELDYDPFLDAQDCDIEWIKTLEVKPIQDKDNVYQIFYNDGYSRKGTTLSLTFENGIFVINSIESNSDLSVIKNSRDVTTYEKSTKKRMG